MESTTEQGLRSSEERQEGYLLDVGHLFDYLKRIKDRRKRRGIRYPLALILLLLILAKLCGEDTIYGIAQWAQLRSESLLKWLPLKVKPKRLPHHSTYRRILSEVIGVSELELIFKEYLAGLVEQGKELIIALDGKTLRGTIGQEEPHGLHLLAAYLPEEGIVLMQMEVEADKENEIRVAPQLLQTLDLRGKIVIGDALHTQRQISAQIVEAGGDYVWIVKENQKHTYQAIEQLFAPERPIAGLGCPPLDFRRAETIDKQAGRLEKRCITVSQALNDYLAWPYLRQVFKLERTFTELASGKETQEVSYGITSLSAEKATPERVLYCVRRYWGIENGLHYRRDVTFHEDRLRIGKVAGQAMAAVNNLVISLFNHLGYKNHAQARREFDACPQKALALLCGL